MLFVAMILVTVGYSMVFSALHGQWEFWTFWFPKKAIPLAAGATPAPAAAPAA